MGDIVIIIHSAADRVIFREYIGLKPYPKRFEFPDIDNNKIDEFHVILAFAHETYNDGKGTGNFYADWDPYICGIQFVKEIKDKYPNVKVIISIGGRDAEYPFNPIEKEYWCDNAVDSLKTIIQQNNFDGIDIFYDHINTNEKDFSNYVGDVINRLKKEVGIDVVSIAPFEGTDKHYKLLYKEHSDDINWVDYQFYMQPIPTETDFLKLLVSLAREYALEKLLIGASTDPRDGGNVPLDVFVKTCTDLVKRKSVRGIFIWNANDSEKIAQDIPNKN